MNREEYNQIKKENGKKLERIMKRKDYQIKLAKKYYGKSYTVTFSGEKHPENSQQRRIKGI